MVAEQTVLISSQNSAGACLPDFVLTFPSGFLTAVLGGQLVTVSSEGEVGEERERLRELSTQDRLRRDCPFPPEPDWA